MTETDSVRLARVEEKLDGLTERLDERHEGIVLRLTCVETDARSLKEDSARALGAAAAFGMIAGAVGGAVLKMIGWGK